MKTGLKGLEEKWLQLVWDECDLYRTELGLCCVEQVFVKRNRRRSIDRSIDWRCVHPWHNKIAHVLISLCIACEVLGIAIAG
jgi:hypothetical protein